jgi:hypothetical protein
LASGWLQGSGAAKHKVRYTAACSQFREHLTKMPSIFFPQMLGAFIRRYFRSNLRALRFAENKLRPKGVSASLNIHCPQEYSCVCPTYQMARCMHLYCHSQLDFAVAKRL